MFFTDIMKHLQILNKIKVFQRDTMSKTFRHFPNLKMTVNAFTEVITDHKVEEYKDKLQGLLEEFQARFDDLQELKLYVPCKFI